MSSRLPHRPRSRLGAPFVAGIALTAGAAVATGAGAPAGAATTSMPNPGAARAAAWSSPGWRAGPWGAGPWGAGAWRAGGRRTNGWGAGPGDALIRRSDTWRSRTEYFHVVSDTSAGPGSIVVTGVVDAGGTEHPGRAVDTATFTGGRLRIDHSAGRPTVHFDGTTCVGTITQHGPFEVIDATGDMASLAGRGHYTFRALYTTARATGHCSHTATGYVETIEGVATVKGR
jgi:hypothetical protein